MATLELDGNEVELEDGALMKEAAEQLGVPFGCRHGACGTCTVVIAEGRENLSNMTDEETDMGMDGMHRLACQCKIKHGKVKIMF